MLRVLIIGATSAIAEATARVYAARGAAVFLAGRNLDRLQAIAADLAVRGAARTGVFALDLNDYTRHGELLDAAWMQLGEIDLVLIAHGTLPDQTACESSVELALREFSTNGLSVIALATLIAPRLKANATLAAITSVAGDRGRASNYLYGSAKAAVSAFLSGLGQRLKTNGVNVLTIKPGFVDTPMTQSFKKGALWAKPDQIAHGIAKAVDRRRAVVYLPWFWWGIMQIIKNIPEFVFRKITL